MAVDFMPDWPPIMPPCAPMHEDNPSQPALIASDLAELIDRGYVRGWQYGNHAARGLFRTLATHAAWSGDMTA